MFYSNELQFNQIFIFFLCGPGKTDLLSVFINHEYKPTTDYLS